MAALLDRYIPRPDVRERFETSIHAPAAIVMNVATHFDMQSVFLVRAVFRMREIFLGTREAPPRRPQGIVEETKNLGWGELGSRSGEYVVCGARCQPWLADVKFHAIAPDDFIHYEEPDYVKIAWTLEAIETAPAMTRFAQETRAVATDAHSRAKFLRYWRWARFGIIAIRLLLLPAIRREAQRRWRMERTRA